MPSRAEVEKECLETQATCQEEAKTDICGSAKCTMEALTCMQGWYGKAGWQLVQPGGSDAESSKD